MSYPSSKILGLKNFIICRMFCRTIYEAREGEDIDFQSR